MYSNFSIFVNFNYFIHYKHFFFSFLFFSPPPLRLLPFYFNWNFLKGNRNDPNHISIWENDCQPFDLTEMRSDPLHCKKKKKKKKEKEKGLTDTCGNGNWNHVFVREFLLQNSTHTRRLRNSLSASLFR
jgi:hypothetical protein